MSYRDRMLADGSDRDAWKVARFPVIGASDAATLAKPASVDKYLAAKLKREVFTGNVFTENGYRWEPLMLAWGGFQHNTALFHAPDEPGFAATPDGLIEFNDGDLALAECKVKHNKVISGPSLAEWRQLAWQFRVFPEAYSIDWIWVEIDETGEIRKERNDEPESIRVYRDDPKIVDLTSKIEPIAVDLLARLRAALEFERQYA
jgi:hypothetical protein